MRNMNEIKTLPKIEVLIASLCYLMSRYAINPAPDVAKAVSEHFELLYMHPDCHPPVLQDVGRRLSAQWESLSVGITQPPHSDRAHVH